MRKNAFRGSYRYVGSNEAANDGRGVYSGRSTPISGGVTVVISGVSLSLGDSL